MTKFKNPPAKPVGRPGGSFGDWRTDPDLPAVVMLDMQLRFASLGRARNSERYYAGLAAAIKTKFPVVQSSAHAGPPPKQLAPKGNRHSPRNPAHLSGYHEIELRDGARPKDKHRLLADRLRKKRLAWRKRPDLRDWISAASYELAKVLYPQFSPEVLLQRHSKTK